MKTLHIVSIACALFAASLAAQAQSSVTLYGIAAIETVRASNVNTGTTIGSMTRIDNSQVTSSRLGFRGVEDLGGGLQALFDLTHGIGLDTGTPASATKFWNRGSWVGLRGSFGTVSFGRHWNVNDDIMSRYFIFGGYAAFRFTEFGFISDLVDNSVKYVSPKLGGFQVRALAGAGEGVVGRTLEVAADYVAGPFAAAVSYRDAKVTANDKSDELTTAGVSYEFGPVRVHGGVSLADPKASALRKARAYDVGVVWTVAPTLIATLDYVDRDQRDTANDSSFIRLGADYYLSKRSSIFGNFVALKNDGTANQRFYGNGTAGKDQNVVALGIRHTF